MQKTIDETARRRNIQLKYNEEHDITPQQIKKDIKETFVQTDSTASNNKQTAANQNEKKAYRPYIEPQEAAFAADPIVRRMTRKQLEKSIENTTALMKEAAKQLDFLQAAQYRDEIVRLEAQLEQAPI